MPAGFSTEIYKSYTTAVSKLGTLMDAPDGGRFRFALNGSVALAAGRVVQAMVPIAAHLSCAVQAAAPAGAYTVSLTLGAAAVVANEYADGYLNINDGGADVTTEGYLYRIKSHPAAGSGGVLVVTLYEDCPVRIALTTNSKGSLYHNPFYGTIIHPSPPTSRVVGVTRCAVPANNYYWAQTKGPASVLTEGALLLGDQVVASATLDGAVAPSAAAETDGPHLGQPMQVNLTTEESLVYLTIE